MIKAPCVAREISSCGSVAVQDKLITAWLPQVHKVLLDWGHLPLDCASHGAGPMFVHVRACLMVDE